MVKGGDRWTEGSMGRRTSQNSPLCPTGHQPFGAAAQKGMFNDFTKKLKGKAYFLTSVSTFDYLLIGISQKGKHFQLTVFPADLIPTLGFEY